MAATNGLMAHIASWAASFDTKSTTQRSAVRYSFYRLGVHWLHFLFRSSRKNDDRGRWRYVFLFSIFKHIAYVEWKHPLFCRIISISSTGLLIHVAHKSIAIGSTCTRASLMAKDITNVCLSLLPLAMHATHHRLCDLMGVNFKKWKHRHFLSFWWRD